MKYDIYLRGTVWRANVEARSPVHALNMAHAVLGDVSRGKIVAVRSDERGEAVTQAREWSRVEPA